MNLNRLKEIEAEALKRTKLWLFHSDFDSMTVCGSRMRFDMALGLMGYPFEKEKWMKKGDFNKFIDDYEFIDRELDMLVDDLFHWARRKNKIKQLN